MKLIKPSYEILYQSPGLEGIYEMIELAGRTCYKSTRKEGTTAKDFVDRMIKLGHLSVLEHGTVYLKIPYDEHSIGRYHHKGTFISDMFNDNPYSVVNIGDDGYMYVTTNYRVLVESFEDNIDFVLKYWLCHPTEYHELRHTVRFVSNIHFYKDITRHRKMSYSIESTRYCNYSKDKFNNELTFIKPAWINEKMTPQEAAQYVLFRGGLEYIESTYLGLIKEGWSPQQAAEVLPQATKAEIIMTGFASDWSHVFELRTSEIAATGNPHPEVARLMDPLYEEFLALYYVGDL